MFHTSKSILRLLAALTWHVGVAVLLIKAASLLFQAHHLRPDELWPLWAALLGTAAGLLKGVFLFSRSCRKNLRRIAALENPKVWQFFRPGFFLLVYW